jgi:hypothetical protein
VDEPARCANGHAQRANDPLERLADLLAERIDYGALASRLAERLERMAEGFAAESQAESITLVDAAEVARMLGKRREWVYHRKRELGGVPLGDGPRPRWGFDAGIVRARLEKRNGPDPKLQAPTPAQRRLPAADQLLPVKDRG